jgi:membrane protein implicated in regulation of membrane protease activity|tara:strand:+ start:1294 stop:1593 length:300 start_codon:yes stop_codon:yes gene_type:complete
MGSLLLFLLLYKVWIIIGVLLIIIEIFDNNFFFLPIGLAALFTAFSLYVDQKDYISELNLLNSWSIILIYFAFLSILSVYILRFIFHSRIEKNKDINKY